MPRATDPNLRFEIVLDSDKDKDPPPTFIYRTVNGREARQLASLNDLVDGRTLSPAVMFDKIFEACAVGLVGWKNMFDAATGKEVPFDAKNIDLIIDPFEAGQHLLELRMALMVPDVEDKKKLESSPASKED